MDQQTVQQVLAQHDQQINNLTVLITSLLNRPSHPRAKLPDPDRFDGSPAMWEVWRPEIEAKLRLDSGVYDTEESKFFYLYSRLSAKIQDLVAPQINAAKRSGYNHQELLDQLDRLCENPNARQKAEDRLHNLHQFDDQTFNGYLLAFERQLYKAEADQWTDGSKIALIRKQLNPKLKKRLKNRDPGTVPTSYADFVKFMQRLDDGSSSGSSKHQEKKVTGDKMDISAMTIGGVAFASEDTLSASSSSEDDKPVGHALYNPATGKYRRFNG